MANIKSFPNNQDAYIGAEDVMKWLHGRTSGVFAADDNAAVAAVQNSMAVTVSDGTGWISDADANGVVWWNDTEKTTGSKLQLTIDGADSVLNRIDRIVVTWITTNYVDLPTITVLKGTAASTATAPALTNNSTQRQISLARVSVAAGTTAITASMITDERLNSSVCGLVTETVEFDTSTVNNQFLALLDEFNTKLAELREQITQAASQSLIDGSVTRAKLATDALYSPVKEISATDYSIVADDIGRTLKVTATAGCTITMSNEVFATLPLGAEIAVLPWIHNGTTNVTITLGSSYYMNTVGNSGTKGGSVTTTERYGMIALKKVTTSSLLITGNVEVVS